VSNFIKIPSAVLAFSHVMWRTDVLIELNGRLLSRRKLVKVNGHTNLIETHVIYVENVCKIINPVQLIRYIEKYFQFWMLKIGFIYFSVTFLSAYTLNMIHFPQIRTWTRYFHYSMSGWMLFCDTGSHTFSVLRCSDSREWDQSVSWHLLSF
jgi:hypothetical protein